MIPQQLADPSKWRPRTTIPTHMPIMPKDVLVVPHATRWKSIKDNEGITKLRKTYSFTFTGKVFFLNELASHEELIQHFIDYLVKFNDQTKQFDITVDLYTHGINSITETDKEFAAFCDIVYAEACYYID
jgi:pterin-4a-carbinolamine dehydratase